MNKSVVVATAANLVSALAAAISAAAAFVANRNSRRSAEAAERALEEQTMPALSLVLTIESTRPVGGVEYERLWVHNTGGGAAQGALYLPAMPGEDTLALWGDPEYYETRSPQNLARVTNIGRGSAIPAGDKVELPIPEVSYDQNEIGYLCYSSPLRKRRQSRVLVTRDREGKLVVINMGVVDNPQRNLPPK